MNQDYNACYETLGLKPGASPEEIKKAYFRLVRKYTPEKAPEQFQKIRQAYEAIKDGPTAKDVDFQPPEDPEALRYISEAVRAYREENYEYAVKQYAKALTAAPDDPFILWELSNTLMDNENWQKAANHLERLTQLRPDSQDAFAMLACSYQNRGWFRKALPAFRRAYDLGERDVRFLTAYANARKDNQEALSASRLFWEAIQSDQPEKDSTYYILQAFCGYAETADFFKSAAVEYLDAYESFLKKNRRRLDDPEDALAPMHACVTEHPWVVADRDLFSRISSLLDRLAGYGNEWEQMARYLQMYAYRSALDQDARSLHQDWTLFTQIVSDKMLEDAQLLRYGKLDYMLCVTEDWDQLKNEYPIIRADYPALLRGYEEYFEQLASGQADVLFSKLKWEFEKLSGKYEGAEYRKRHPERQEKTVYVSKDTDLTPYVRSGDKVGRNDPCPCGSGKKFKKCCMGKGIYD